MGIGFFLIFSFTSANLFFEGNLAYGHANAPVISSAITSATNEITVTFSSTHNIDQSSVSRLDFSISGDGVSGLSISSATGTGNREATITLSGDVSVGTITLEVIGEIQNSHGNASLTSGTTSVTNNGGDNTAPTMDSAITVTTTRIDVTFSEDLDASTINASDFGIQGSNGVSAAAENSAGVVTLTLNSAIDTGDTPTVTRGSGSCASNSISDLVGNTMCPTTLTATDGLSPTFTAERTAVDVITITFSEDVDADSSNETSAWTVSGGTVTATSDPANSDSMTIIFSGITDTTSTPTVTYVAANGTVDDVANNEISNGESTVATDGVGPTVTITSLSGTDGSTVNLSILNYIVTFSESVSDFVIGDITKTGNSTSVVSNFAGSGSTYTFNVDITSDGSVIVQIEENVARDSLSNKSTESNIYSLSSSSSSSANPTISLTNLKPHPSAINLSDSANSDRQPVVNVNGTNVHVTWHDNTNSDTLYKRSTNSGATFSDVVTVGDGNASWLSTSPVDMEVVGDNVYIVWDGSDKTYFSRSTDNGATFSAAVKLEDYGRPKISADGNNVHVIAWGEVGDDNVKYLKSTDSGANFAAAKNAGIGGIVSDVESRGDNLYISARSGADSMKLHKSTDGGANFATSNLTTCTDFPTIEYTSTYLHFGCGWTDLKYLVSDDAGGSWGSALTISSDWAPVAPSISNGTNYGMVWRHHGVVSDAAQIRFASSTDEGVTFGTPSIIDGLGRHYNSQEPSIHADGNLIGAAFTSCTTNLASNICDIFFTRSTNGGTTFTPPGGSSQISHAIGANTDEQIFNATGVSGLSIIDIETISPAHDYTIVTPNLNATIPANTTPLDANYAQLTIKNSTRTINTNTNPDASVVGTIQELGYTNSTNIEFDKFIKLSFKGTTGSTPFFINATDTYLINQCDGTPATTTQASNDATITGGANECYWTATNSTKFVWTNHFTAFGTGNNFGSSSSSSSGSSSGGGGNNCDSNGFGNNNSLRVYQVMYDVDTYEVLVQAYSTCGSISVKITTPSERSILGLSMDQPYFDDRVAVYSGFLDESDDKFNISIQNKRHSFNETFYIHDKSITKKYTGDTGYTSEQQDSFSPIIPSTQITVTSEPSIITASQTIKESIPVEKQIVTKKSVIDQTQSIQYTPEPIAEETTESTCGIGTESVNGICKIIIPDEPQFCFLFWCW